MKALYLPGPKELRLTDIPKPTPSADEALVKVTHAGLCHTDVIIREGNAPWVNYPTIPCHEFSGIVEECGAACDYVEPGDRVTVHTIIYCGYCSACRREDHTGCENKADLGSIRPGGFAEYCSVLERFLYKLPDHVSLEEASMIEPLANSISAVRNVDIKIGQRVVVIGPGPIGLLAVAIARLYSPSSLTLVGTRDTRLAIGSTMGATHTLNITKPGAVETLKQDILGGKGADVIIECAGTQSAIKLALDVMGRNCRIGLEGSLGAGNTFALSGYEMQEYSAKMIGINGWLTKDFVQAVELVGCGKIDVRPIITQRFPLEQWEEAFEMIVARKDECVKVIITI